jgi:hypothetical protein
VLTALFATTNSNRPALLRFVTPLAGAPLAPSPYELLLVELIDASCVWITNNKSPAAIAVEAPVMLLAPTEMEVVPEFAVPVPGK